MNKILFGILISSVVIILGLGMALIAQERRIDLPGDGEIIMLGGLKLKEGADPEGAEKLFKEQLIPAMIGIEGLKMKVLKRVKMPNEQTDPNVYDYIMMAELENPQVLTKLSPEKDPRLDKFGEMMKEYAGHPYINAYTIIARTDTPKSE